RHVTSDRRIAKDEDGIIYLRAHRILVDGHPTGFVGYPCINGNGTCTLRRDDVEESALKDVEIGLDCSRRCVYRLDAAVDIGTVPFDHARVVRFPALSEQRLFREAFLVVEHEDFRARETLLLQNVSEHGDALVRSRRAAEWIWR